MYDTDAFTKREQALEDEFFHRVDTQLRAELRRSIERDRSREGLQQATGLSDPELLDALVDSGFQATTLAALVLVPAIFVAWADHKVDELESKTILKAAKARGLNGDGLAVQLLETWLKKRPPHSLWETWKRYTQTVNESLPKSSSKLLSKEVLKLATSVAEVSGGVLGFGNKSQSEKEVLAGIEQTFASEA